MPAARAITIPENESDVELTIAGKRVKLTNLDKLFWRDAGITKRDLLQYYADVAPALLPHLRDRAMVMKRYPNGATGKCFFMKRVPEPHPAWIETCTHRAQVGKRDRLPDGAGPRLAALGRQPRLHRPQSVVRALRRRRSPRLPALRSRSRARRPKFDKVLDAALIVRDALEALGMTPLVKTTGSKGVHIYVPIVRGPLQKQVWTLRQGARADARRAASRSC